MIKNVKFSTYPNSSQLDLEEDVLMTYEKEGRIYEIRLEELRKYWECADKDEIERATFHVDGNYIIMLLTVASDQGGIVAIQDALEDKLIHISDGAYGLAAAVCEGFVYTFCGVHNFMTPLNFIMTRVPIGTMDAFGEVECDKNFSFDDEEAYNVTLHGNSIHLFVDKKNYIIQFKDKKYQIERKEEFAHI